MLDSCGTRFDLLVLGRLRESGVGGSRGDMSYIYPTTPPSLYRDNSPEPYAIDSDSSNTLLQLEGDTGVSVSVQEGYDPSYDPSNEPQRNPNTVFPKDPSTYAYYSPSYAVNYWRHLFDV